MGSKVCSSTENMPETAFRSRNIVAQLIFKETDVFPEYSILTYVLNHRSYSGAKDPLTTDG